MKRGFTLIELLITVAIMATLMTIMFRIGTSSSDESKRIETVTRLQKLENCLSGYYSAFGSYPPVKLHGSRDIHMVVENGVQTDERSEGYSWQQIEAACRSQPFEACFPFDENAKGTIQQYSDYFKKLSSYWTSSDKSAMFSTGFGLPSWGEFTSYWEDTDWEQVQLFKFGVMSFLLPRYLVMMKGDERFYGAKGSSPCGQWSSNNDTCISATTGKEMTWRQVYDAVELNDNNDSSSRTNSKNPHDYIQVANMPSQAVCARWIGNLEKLCATGDKAQKIFGVNIKDTSWDMFECDQDNPPNHLNVYTPGGQGGSYYVLDTITVLDGWKNTFYYYSPSGAQTYQLWSSGPNGRTFPPWVDKSNILDERPEDNEKDSALTIGQWLEDDIGGMKH